MNKTTGALMEPTMDDLGDGPKIYYVGDATEQELEEVRDWLKNLGAADRSQLDRFVDIIDRALM